MVLRHRDIHPAATHGVPRHRPVPHRAPGTARPAPAAAALLALQRSVGNRAVQRLTAGPTGPGGGLPAALRGSMEASFHTDFDEVRLHTDAAAHELVSGVGARALTEGNDVYFASGEYRPDHEAGRQLLGHELAHVVQQRCGRAPGGQGHRARTLRADPALEAEADRAGWRAARGQDAGLAERPVRATPSAGAAAQPKLGFEVEMLVLTDIGGRPLPEKIPLGTYGSEQVELTVDHNAEVTAPTPVPAATAGPRTIPQYKGQPLTVGAYDLPPTAESRASVPSGQDTRPEARWLGPDWPVVAAAVPRGVPNLGQARGDQPGELDAVDRDLATYRRHATNWEQALAANVAAGLLASATGWLNTARTPTGRQDREAGRLAALGPLTAFVQELTAHHAYWASHAATRPATATTRYRDVPPHGAPGEWSEEHPVEHFLGQDTYHSILEVVTRPYEAETPQGAQGVVRAMQQAADLAARVMTATRNLTTRAPLSATGAQVTNPDTWIGHPSNHAQSVDASVQSTFAVDLAQLPSLMSSVLGLNSRAGRFRNPLYGIKHQGDVESGSLLTGTVMSVAFTEAARAPEVASAALRQAAAADGLSATDMPSLGRLSNLRGLVTLLCQYLLMGRHFSQNGAGALDKNIVPLLSRTDLAHVFRALVPGPSAMYSPNSEASEKEWAIQHNAALRAAILTQCGRDPGSPLFTNADQTWHGPARAPFTVSCRDFVTDVFTADSDGVTPTLDEGLFKKMGPEQVHPTGSTRADQPRTGPVFELRNMTRPPLETAELGTDRTPPERWAQLAEYFARTLTLLHARTDEDARRDERVAPILDYQGLSSVKEFPSTNEWWS